MEMKTKTEYISRMLNKRTKNKNYENFVINQIYARLDNPELEIITQQCVRITNSNYLNKIDNHHYLIDLYFPQINFAVEVDEGHHETIQNHYSDKERENYIKGAVSCEIERIKICEEGTQKERDFEDILSQIKKVIEKINSKIINYEAKNGKLKWTTNEDKIAQVKKNMFFDVTEKVHFLGITNVLNLLSDDRYSLYQKSVKKYDDYMIWIPVLSIKMDDGKIKTANGCENYINEDGTEIIEISKKGGCKGWGKWKRVVFLKMKDELGNRCCRFVGVFKDDHIEYDGKRQKNIYKRIDTKISFADIVGHNK